MEYYIEKLVGDGMKIKWTYLIGGLIGIIVVTSIIVPVAIHFLAKDNLFEPGPIIIIMNDEDFEKYYFLGDGSESNPYIIENYNITTSENNAIYISSTTKYFIIRNCTLAANLTGIYIKNIAYGTATITQNICINHFYYGIYLLNSPGVSISRNFCYRNYFSGICSIDCANLIMNNNTCYKNSIGVYLSYLNNITVSNNTFNNNLYAGIELYFSSNVTLANNTCYDNFYKGIRLDSSSNVVLTNNSCNDNMNGFYLLNSTNLVIANNTCSNNTFLGINLINSSNVELINNNFFNCGLDISHNTNNDYFSYIVESNWVNNKQLGYFINSSSSTISNSIYGQLILINCSDMIISNLEIVNVTIGLTLKYCKNLILINNTCKNCISGISLKSSPNSTLVNNTCKNNWDGISLHSTNNTFLTNNTCNNNSQSGISLDFSSDVELTNNTCNNNDVSGISLWYSTDIIITKNTCNNNNFAGVDLTSSNIIMSYNIINNNSLGLSAGYSDYCLIIYNSFRENTNHAISFHYESNNNIVHHNSFIDNNLVGDSQAEDEWMNNIWYDTATNKGNYWSDWAGIGDYEIDGNANATDPYPLSSPP